MTVVEQGDSRRLTPDDVRVSGKPDISTPNVTQNTRTEVVLFDRQQDSAVHQTIELGGPAIFPPDGYIDLDTVATKLGIKTISTYPFIKGLVDKRKLGRKLFVREADIDRIVSERQEKRKKVATSRKKDKKQDQPQHYR